MKKLLVFVLAIALAVVLGWRIYDKTAASPRTAGDRRKAEVAVEVAPVQRETIRDVRVFTGSLNAAAYFVVAPKISGRLERLTVDIGDRVRSGQLVAVLDDDEYAQGVEQAGAELDVAKANVAQARSSLAVAKREYARVETLREKNISSESELDTARLQYEAEEARYQVSLAQVARREALLKAAEVRLSYTQIKVTWEAGSEHRAVGERFVDEGAMLSPGTPIVSILDISSLKAVVNVIERDYAKIRTGQEASITTDAYAGREFSGTVTRVAPLLKKTSRQARVEIRIPNAEGLLKPGMFVRAGIEFARHEDAVVVPRSALVKRDGRQGVFLVDREKSTARFVPLQVGIIEGSLVEVVEPQISGLVVTLGHHMLGDGTAIVLPDADSPGGTKPESGDSGN